MPLEYATASKASNHQMNPTAASDPAHLTPAWQRELAAGFRSPQDLLAALELDPSLLPAALAGARDFPLRVPRSFVARMRKRDPLDPLLLQVLPAAAELAESNGYSSDPVGDMHALQGGGLLHKYHGRVLLVATGACAIHCRYCFRRHFPYSEASATGGEWQAALDYIGQHRDIEEVILSGGDPLSLNDRRLSVLAHALADIPHVRRLRVHSRLPVVLPSRIDASFMNWFTGTRLQAVMVIHANHANELNDEVEQALAPLRAKGVTLLNQSVLLKGINDDAGTLATLSERLFEIGVLPYYLHLLDRVRGGAHFDLPESAAKALYAQLAARLSGYLLPRLVKEEPGLPNKTLLAP